MKYGIMVFFCIYVFSMLIESLGGFSIPNNYQLGFSIFGGAITAMVFKDKK